MDTQTGKNQKTVQYSTAVIPTYERHSKMGGLRFGLVKSDRAPTAVVQRYRARWASPLDLYRDKQLIDCAQHQAGLRFGQAYRYAVACEVACRERSRRINDPEAQQVSDCFQQALDYVEQAYLSLSSDTVNVVIDVCAYATPVSSPETLSKLRKGLQSLAYGWGMASTELCQRR